ncbi:hypothetical protein [Rhizomicrobium electricum]|uniref:Lipoprotein n=1 Tax=Rhizomicrobium electricum TaxID=480070 RepID=A0ABP3PNC5_9PROT|nr:hypothetical protein [Rhizomicrobium electricum]NIJ48387.1 hypothetical protein [Rhizomicrobium electricum]
MRYWMILLIGLFLAGCYESNDLLLDPAAARQPIATGKDWTYGSGDRRYHARLTAKPDGWYDYAEAHLDAKGTEGPWRTHTVVLNYLTTANGYDVFVYGTYNRNDSAYMYGLIVVGKNGFWQTVMPNCDPANADAKWLDADTDAATGAGAKIKAIDDFERVCHFTTREQLFAALRSVMVRPEFWSRVKTAGR